MITLSFFSFSPRFTLGTIREVDARLRVLSEQLLLLCLVLLIARLALLAALPLVPRCTTLETHFEATVRAN